MIFFSQYSSALKVKCRGDLSQVYVNHSEIFKKYEVYIYAYYSGLFEDPKKDRV